MKSVTGRYSHQGGDVTWYENTQDLVGATQLTQQKMTSGSAMAMFVCMTQCTLVELSFGHPLAKQIPDMHSPILAGQRKKKLFARPGALVKIIGLGIQTITHMGIGKCIRGLTERTA